MSSVKVILYKHKTLSDGSHPILVSVIKDLKRKTFSLGYSSTVSQWNKKQNLPGSNHPNKEFLTAKIKRVKADITDIILFLENKGKPFNVEDIIKNYKNELTEITFEAYCNKLITNFKEAGKNGNLIVYQSTLDSFKKFSGEKNFLLNEIDYSIVSQYQEFLQKKVNISKDKKTEKKLTLNGISFYLRTLRAILNKAIKEGLYDEKFYPFKKISIKSENTRKRAVNKDVIKVLEDLDVSKEENLQLYKDLFLFSFYNRGMNFVDMVFLKARNIQNGRLNYSRQKTGQQFTIKITEKALAIIKRYNDLANPDNYVFPVVFRKSNEYLDYRNAMRLMNKKLKKISGLMNLDVPLTTYVTRHSWATIAKRSGIATAVISEGLGHTTEEITQVYLDSFENDTLDAANELITG